MENEYSDFGTEQETSIMPPQTQDKKEGVEIGVIRELSSRKVLEQLKMNMKGYEWDEEKKKWDRIEMPLMNDEGVRRYIAIMRSVISDVVTFSSYKDEEIYKLTQYVCDNAIPVIHINHKTFGIKEKSDLPIIDTQILSLTLAAFKKAVGAGDRSVIGRTISENIMTRAGNMQQFKNEERGFFSRMNPFSR